MAWFLAVGLDSSIIVDGEGKRRQHAKGGKEGIYVMLGTISFLFRNNFLSSS